MTGLKDRDLDWLVSGALDEYHRPRGKDFEDAGRKLVTYDAMAPEDRARSIMAAVLSSATVAPRVGLEPLLAPPLLTPEEGEPSQESLPDSGSRSHPFASTQAPDAADKSESAARRTSSGSRRNRRPVAAGLVVAVVAIAAGLAGLFSRPHGAVPATTSASRAGPGPASPTAAAHEARETATDMVSDEPSEPRERGAGPLPFPSGGAEAIVPTAGRLPAPRPTIADTRPPLPASTTQTFLEPSGLPGMRPAELGPTRNAPEQPTQGAILAWSNKFIGLAHPCVSGATDVSPVTVTFASTGAVRNVVVAGWAAANGRAECLRAAAPERKCRALPPPIVLVVRSSPAVAQKARPAGSTPLLVVARGALTASGE